MYTIYKTVPWKHGMNSTTSLLVKYKRDDVYTGCGSAKINKLPVLETYTSTAEIFTYSSTQEQSRKTS